MLNAVFFLLAVATTTPSTRPGGEIVPPPRRDVPGVRTALPVGELFIPDFVPTDAKEPLDLVIWFHGAAWCAEQVFYDARKDASILVVNAKTWQAGFADPKSLDALVAEVEKAQGRSVGRIVLASFSGGYTAVRDILRHYPPDNRIVGVALLDSLYAPRLGEKKDRLDPAAMEPFIRYAKRAAAGEPNAWLFFTQLYPPLEEHRGNTTTLAAMYLIDAVAAEKKPATAKNSRGTQTLLYRADKANFHILGYAGMTNQDHFEHFYSAADVLKLAPLRDAPKGATTTP